MTTEARNKKRKVDFADAGKVVKKTALKSALKKGEQRRKSSETTSSTLASSKDVPTGQDASQPVPEPSRSVPSTLSIQIVTGDYERVTHGLAATIKPELLDGNSQQVNGNGGVTFTETFLFAAHTASIRCLAISPEAENSRRFLATGSADERINLYSISTAPPSTSRASSGTLNGAVVLENASNRSLGSLLNHDRAITRLHFPVKSKLFSAAEDNTVAITRTRDWTMLSSVKAPLAKVQGRPSGDTAAPGEVPTGINDFAIHPSQKLMLSASRGEKCMRLWNLMTGKKAGVLNFDRDLLTQAGEGKHSSGEGRRVLWDALGESYIVGFERNAVWFGVDSQPRAILKPSTPTKLHQYRFITGTSLPADSSILAISTENGRILLFDLSNMPKASGSSLPIISSFAHLGSVDNTTTRIKDFEILPVSNQFSAKPMWIAVAASSDGCLRLWTLLQSELLENKNEPSSRVGQLIAQHKIESRITCLGAFVLDGVSNPATDETGHDNAADQSEEEDDD